MSLHVEELILSLCRQHPEGLPNTTLEARLRDVSVEARAGALNKLLAQKRLQLLVNPNDPKSMVFKEVDEQTAFKYKNLTSEEMLVYQQIKLSSNLGIWTRDLKSKTNLQQPQITKIIKILEQRKLIKAVKSISNQNRKVYMLYELEPAKEITGGAWYTENEFDSEFFEVLQNACYQYIQQRDGATLEEIADFIKDKNLARTELELDEIGKLVDTLEYDGKISSSIEDDQQQYYCSDLNVSRSNAYLSVPCGMCPVISDCTEDGPISPSTCVYYQKWLDF